VLEQEALPQWLSHRRWFAGSRDEPVRLLYAQPFCADPAPCVLCELQVGDALYQLPLGYLPMEQAAENSAHVAAAFAVARLRRGPRLGLLTDAATLADFTRPILAGLRAGQVLGSDQQIRFLPAAGLLAQEPVPEEEIQPITAEQSNTSILIGERML